ncbi:MAG: carboxypeptidase regulatory-like domain-containing protein [Candidatus Methanoperedens sp.]|nr:carboxypeptidase regulatory-like domain-containing protein [Candidatus Methanoperedens sp.]
MKMRIIIFAVILALMTGIAAAETQKLIKSIDADLVIQVGDMDNLGFGWPPGFDVFSGNPTPVHSYPFQPGAQDPPGTDMIMVGTSYIGRPPAGQDGYTRSTKRPANLPQAINMQYDLKDVQVKSASFQMFVDDFQSPVWKSKFQVTLNEQQAPFMEDVLNTLVQSGPIGKLITVQIPSDFLPMVRRGKLNISIDDPTTGAGDGFAIDFVRLLINPHITTVGNVSGNVTDNLTGSPLKGVVISASGTVIKKTAKDGTYVLRGVPAGLVVINASKKGYVPQSKSVDLIAGSDITLDFALQPIAKQTIVENNDGYDLVSYVDGLKDVINGDLNFLRWDGVWRPKSELNISNGSWPYRISENKSTTNFKLGDVTLSIPKANAKFKRKLNSISYDLIYSKSDLRGKEYLDINYSLKSKKQVIEYKDDFNIIYGSFHFKAGTEHISVHDDTLRNYTEDGKVFQDVTYLDNEDYDFRIVDGNIRLTFKKNAIDKLHGNVIIEIRTWEIVGANNSLWGGNVTFDSTTEVRSTGNVELKQKVDDYSLYSRFDEGNGITIHNENISNVLEGYLEGYMGNNSTSGKYVPGRYGQAFYFNGINNKVLFNDHPDVRLPFDFTISLYLKLTPEVDNLDTDIIRKGSTATAFPKAWYKLEITDNLIHGDIQKGSVTDHFYDIMQRKNGNWHFLTFTRQSDTCSLMVDDVIIKSGTCKKDTANTARFSIGAKDTYIQTTGLDFTNGFIDEVRIYNRQLNASELALIRNNSHYPAGTVTRNLSSLIQAGEELKESGCNGTWDRSTTKVDILASTNNTTWDTIQSNAIANTGYIINPGNNYTFARCSLSTTDPSNTPIIESIRARIGPKGSSYNIAVSTSPEGLSPQPGGGGQYTYGENITVTAKPVNGYTFQNWSEGGSQVSTSAEYEFIVTGNRNLIAVYRQDADSLAGYWRFDNESGENSTFFRDWSNHGNNATCILPSCPTIKPGKFGNALDFDGTNDYIVAGNGSSLDLTGSITVEAWVKPGRLETAYLVKKATRDSTDGYELSLSKATGKAYFRVNQKTSHDTYKLFSNSSYPVDGNTWVHLAGVFNGSHVQVYFNGKLENSMPGPANISSNTDNLRIGGPDDSRYFKGTIDEVIIWNRALSPEEINASYRSGI